MGKLIRVAIVGAVVLGASLGLATTASAAVECSSGYACIWEHDSYSGQYHFRSVTSGDYTTLSNAASSAGANGTECARTRFYDLAGHTSGDYFTLYSATQVGTNYQDPNLTNGVGFDGAGENWDNRVSSHLFVGC